MEITINPKSQIIYFIPLFALFLFLSGCATGSDKKKGSGLFDNVNMVVQQNQILKASIVERDKIVLELSDRLNKLADKLEYLLAEKKELEKKASIQTAKVEQLTAKNEIIEEDLPMAKRTLPGVAANISELQNEIESLNNKLRLSQEMSKVLSSEVTASIKISRMYRSVNKKLSNRILTGEVDLLHDQTHISIRFPNISMFEPGEVNPTKKGKKLIEEVATALQDVLNQDEEFKAHVYGFTDNVPIKQPETALAANNQELSLSRAEQVRDILANTISIDPGDIQVKGYGESYPVADNATAIGRIKNRRVVIIVSSKNSPEKGVIDAFLQFEKKIAGGK